MAIHSVERIHLDQSGYDEFGCYWGAGEPLWRVTHDESGLSDTVRAEDPISAVETFMVNKP